jgi:hypothetical protein
VSCSMTMPVPSRAHCVPCSRWCWTISHTAQTCCCVTSTYSVQFWSENLKRKDHMTDPAINERVILKLILQKQNVKMWNGVNWLRIGCNSRL